MKRGIKSGEICVIFSVVVLSAFVLSVEDVHGFQNTPEPWDMSSTTFIMRGGFTIVAFMITLIIGRALWYWKKLTKIKAIHAPRREIHNFKRNSKTAVQSLAVSGLFVFLGFFHIYLGSPLGYLWFGVSGFWLFVSFWSWKIPYLYMTEDEIILLENVGRKPRTIEWNTVKEISIVPSRVELFLSTNERIGIDLPDIHEEDREAFVQTLKEITD